MIPWWVIVAGFVAGVAAAALAAEFGWLLQRAGDGRGGRGKGFGKDSPSPAAPPYDWSREGDL